MRGVRKLFRSGGRATAARRAGLLLVLAVTAVALGAVASTAAAQEIPAEIVVRSQEHPGPNDPHRCVAYAFMMFPEVAGATAYEGYAEGHLGSNDVAFSGPPFSEDTYSWYPAVFTVDAGKHWFALGGASTGAGCPAAEAALAGRFSVLYMRADFGEIGNTPPVPAPVVSRDPDNPRLVRVDGTGSVDPDGAIVGYRWTFGDGASASGAVAQHEYAGGGRYTVTLSVTDDDGATVPGTAVADIPYEVTGRLTERRCGTGGNCRTVAVPGIRVAASGSAAGAAAISAADGSYRLLLTQGVWAVTPDQPRGQRSWDPASRPVAVFGNVAGQDFRRCATGAERPLSGCGEPTARIARGEAADPRAITFDPSGSTDPDGRIVRYEWGFGDGTTASTAGPRPVTHQWTTAGQQAVTLRVTDDQGDSSTARVTVETHAVVFEVQHVDDGRAVRGVPILFSRGQVALPPASDEVPLTTGANGRARAVVPDGRYIAHSSDQRHIKSTQGFIFPGTRSGAVGFVYVDYVNLRVIAETPASTDPDGLSRDIDGVTIHVTGRATRNRTVDETDQTPAAVFGLPPSAGAGYRVVATCGRIRAARTVAVPEDPEFQEVSLTLDLRPVTGDLTRCPGSPSP